MFAFVLTIITIWTLAYFRASLRTWTLSVAGLLLVISLFSGGFFIKLLWLIFAIVVITINLPFLRTKLVTGRALKMFRKVLPTMSRTEKEALDAGTVWWDGDLFSGDPDWQKLHQFPVPQLTKEEQAFIDGPVEILCKKLDDWQINQTLNDLPEEAWQFIKQSGFFGIIIPKRYGGLDFSAFAHSEIVTKIASRSIAGAVTVMVPNSLGPAELLLRYGTEAQKDHYLPRLAKGEEVPCFALTNPEAGSDASSLPDTGIVCHAEYEGQSDVLGIRVSWNKRYITLGPVATVLGLAFQLRDPDHLLGLKENLGITCALIPANHPGVQIGRRHHPLGIGIQNGPNWGKDVFIPMDWVIGGQKQVGQGWRMLMECLAAGRSISLPALSVGGAKFISRAVGAYARIRKQFKTPLGYFEGIEEPLTRLAGNTYMMDAARRMTASALDQGEQPSVISAILKYHLTERLRQAINDGMDIQGGAGICLGPHNLLGNIYHSVPISITVEGANILTRSLIIYGQGAIRCHPYVLKEINAANETDLNIAIHKFDEAFCQHVGFTLSNMARTSIYGLTLAKFISAPVTDATENYYKQLTRFSSAFAFVSDISMLVLGGNLKRKEKLSGRLADVLSLLYLTSATLKRYHEEERQHEDLSLVKWICETNLYQIQQALVGIIQNFPNKIFAVALKLLVFPLGQHLKPASDHLGHTTAQLLLSSSATRDRLTAGIFIPTDSDEQVARLETALGMAQQADELEKRVHIAHKKTEINGVHLDELFQAALEKNIITQDEMTFYSQYSHLRNEIITVDDFDFNQFRRA